MIVENLVDFFLNMISTLFNGVEFFNLDLSFIDALTTILAYGNWVVGIPIMAAFTGSVIFWWTFQMSIGLIVWVWDRLPLT